MMRHTALIFTLLALSPIWSAFHLGFASHLHRFDTINRQFVDVVVIEGNPQERAVTHKSPHNRVEKPSPLRVFLTSCGVSSLMLVNAVSPASIPPCVSFPDVYRSTRSNRILTLGSEKTFALAPKQSPPACQS
ncbi:MAG: hypothetical protein QNJ97_10910 [Myxococcota bacterium]|nr:hypothetical protein [Myxococcota bacterium]